MTCFTRFNFFINSVKFGSPDDFFQFYKNKYLEKPSNIGSRPIHIACKFQNVSIVKILIDLKCNINIAGEDGMYPIHFACKNGNFEIAKLLIKAGCSLKDNFVCVRNGYFPIHFACISGNLELVKLLVALKCELGSTPYESILYYFTKELRFMNYSKDAIHLACTHGCVQILQYLIIDRKHNIEAECKIRNMRPIHFAVENENVEIVKILTDLNCNVNYRDRSKRSPLDIAIKQENQEIINILKRRKFANTAARGGLRKKACSRVIKSPYSRQRRNYLIASCGSKLGKTEIRKSVDCYCGNRTKRTQYNFLIVNIRCCLFAVGVENHRCTNFQFW